MKLALEVIGWVVLCGWLLLFALGAANPAGVACRYCHPVQCLTSEFCGEGCSCFKGDGESVGRCVAR